MVGVYIPIIRIPYFSGGMSWPSPIEGVEFRPWHIWRICPLQDVDPTAEVYHLQRDTFAWYADVGHLNGRNQGRTCLTPGHGTCWYALIGVCRHPGSEWVQNPLMFLKEHSLIFMIHCESVFRKGPMNLSLSGGLAAEFLPREICLIGQTYCPAQHSRIFQSYYLPGDSIRDLFIPQLEVS